MQRLILILLMLATFGLQFLFLPSANAEKLPVFVSIIPQKYLIEQLAGDAVNVEVMVQPGASPATYEPKPRQMALLSDASIYFAIGVPFEEAWLPRIAATNRKMKIIHMDKGLKKLPMAVHHHEGDHHDEHHEKAKHHDEHKNEHEHEHEQNIESEGTHGLDPHVWLSPAFAKQMALTARKTLTRALPEHAATIRGNYRKLEQKIDSLDEEIFNIFASIPEKDRTFMVFHPSWGYFAASFALKQIPIEYEGKEPTPKMLASLIDEAKEQNIQTLFIQPQFNTKSAQTIARQINGSLVVADPLAYEWDTNLRNVAKKLARSFQREKTQ